jgi:predicted dehydrogenase
VAITVRVARHFDIASAAISAGKHVYCEWPLGVDTAQARELAALSARHPDRVHLVGLQGRLTPEVGAVAAAIASGRIGRPLRANLEVHVPQALQARPKHRAHLRHRSAAANVLSIQGGHALDMLGAVLGPPGEVAFARIWTAVDEFTVLETGERLPGDAPDNVVAQLELGGVPVTVQLSQTSTRPGSVVEVLGTTASVRIIAPDQPQMCALDVIGTDLDRAPEPWPTVFDEDGIGLDRTHVGYGVALAYSRLGRSLRDGDIDATLATFDDAVVAHELIDAIERAAEH